MAGWLRAKQATAPNQNTVVGITGNTAPIAPATNKTMPAEVQSRRASPRVDWEVAMAIIVTPAAHGRYRLRLARSLSDLG